MRQFVSDTPSLTDWQRRLLGLLARGYSVNGIATATMYSKAYVYMGLRELRRSLGVATYTGAVIEGLRQGVIELPEPEEMALQDEDEGGY